MYELIKNESRFWDFVKALRFHEENVSGFVTDSIPTDEEQKVYMQKYGHLYHICINEQKEPVGFIGSVDGDIRLAVEPSMKKKGIGKFMLSNFILLKPFSKAKVLYKNKASLRLFFSCGFVSKAFDGKFFHLVKNPSGYYNTKHNPYKIVQMFEETIADYTGSTYAIAVDSCTNALFLCCKYLKVQNVSIPSKTYLSVPQSIVHAGGSIIFDESRNNWSGCYSLDPYPIWDSAKRLTSNMFIPNSLMCLSFHIKKTLKIGKGGMILTDDIKAVEFFKKARYEGRSETLYHKDNISTTGWNMYMTPQQAAHGLCLMQNYPLHVPDLGENEGYKDLRDFKLFNTEL